MDRLSLSRSLSAEPPPNTARTVSITSPGPERVPETVYLEKIKKIFIFFENFRNIFGWGALPPRPPNFWLGGQSPPRPPLNGRSSHLIEAAKRGRLDQMLFFSAPLTIRAPLTARAPLTTVRRPEAKFTSAACRMPSLNFLQPFGRYLRV